MEEQAIYIGLSLHYFWSLNPKQWKKYVHVYEQKEKERRPVIDDVQFLNFQRVNRLLETVRSMF